LLLATRKISTAIMGSVPIRYNGREC
jgi:hypothetical protein